MRDFGLQPASSLLGRDGLLPTPLKGIRTALEKQCADDVLRGLRGIHLAPHDVGQLEQVSFEAGEGQGHGVLETGTPREQPDKSRLTLNSRWGRAASHGSISNYHDNWSHLTRSHSP